MLADFRWYPQFRIAIVNWDRTNGADQGSISERDSPASPVKSREILRGPVRWAGWCVSVPFRLALPIREPFEPSMPPVGYVAYIDEAGDDGLRSLRTRELRGASQRLTEN